MRRTTRPLGARLARLEDLAPSAGLDAAPGYICITPAELARMEAGELPPPPPGCKVYVGVCPTDWTDL